MDYAVGFFIAFAIGLTGLGGGSFTVPVLVLLFGLAPAPAVGTAFVFAGVVRLIAAPFYMAGRNFHLRYLALLLLGAVPGLVIGTVLLRNISHSSGTPAIVLLLGIILTASSAVSFIPRMQRPDFTRKNPRWLPWLALPIGAEAGFSSAGAGTLGTVLLLNFSEMTAAQVVGTDLLFGLILALVGSTFHWEFGVISGPVLWHLLVGGVPGVLLGCLSARAVPARRLKVILASLALLAGLQLVWNGARSLLVNSIAASGRKSLAAGKLAHQAWVDANPPAATKAPGRSAD